jgi:starch-binding outer membrane protein, SusD/RagB family
LNQPQEALHELNKIRERAFGNTLNNYVLADIATEELFYEIIAGAPA